MREILLSSDVSWVDDMTGHSVVPLCSVVTPSLPNNDC